VQSDEHLQRVRLKTLEASAAVQTTCERRSVDQVTQEALIAPVRGEC
jgi:hypothetical protein